MARAGRGRRRRDRSGEPIGGRGSGAVGPRHKPNHQVRIPDPFRGVMAGQGGIKGSCTARTKVEDISPGNQAAGPAVRWTLRTRARRPSRAGPASGPRGQWVFGQRPQCGAVADRRRRASRLPACDRRRHLAVKGRRKAGQDAPGPSQPDRDLGQGTRHFGILVTPGTNIAPLHQASSAPVQAARPAARAADEVGHLGGQRHPARPGPPGTERS